MSAQFEKNLVQEEGMKIITDPDVFIDEHKSLIKLSLLFNR